MPYHTLEMPISKCHTIPRKCWHQNAMPYIWNADVKMPYHTFESPISKCYTIHMKGRCQNVIPYLGNADNKMLVWVSIHHPWLHCIWTNSRHAPNSYSLQCTYSIQLLYTHTICHHGKYEGACFGVAGQNQHDWTGSLRDILLKKCDFPSWQRV